MKKTTSADKKGSAFPHSCKHTPCVSTASSSCALAQRVRMCGLKATPQRLALLHVLASENHPLPLHEIVERIDGHAVNQSTLYRAVRDLAKVGMVRSVDFRHTHAHYELVTEDEHHHIICTSCGVVEEYVSPYCDTVTQEALAHSSAFAKIVDHSFELYGICKKCVRNVSKTRASR